MTVQGTKKVPAKAGGPGTTKTAIRPGARATKKVQKTAAAQKNAAGKKNPRTRGKSRSGPDQSSVVRYKCRLCGYIYSPLRGEPHNGIPRGTPFEDLPESYICPVCGQEGKGKVGKWGFEEWLPTRYLCTMCNYVYDEKRGEPHRGIKPGTKFEDLPDDYVCPVCAQDPKILLGFGKVFKNGFEPLDY